MQKIVKPGNFFLLKFDSLKESRPSRSNSDLMVGLFQKLFKCYILSVLVHSSGLFARETIMKKKGSVRIYLYVLESIQLELRCFFLAPNDCYHYLLLSYFGSIGQNSV